MPAKRPAPKSAKGKKAASRSTTRKAVARKPDAARPRIAAAAHPRKNSAVIAPARKPAPAAPAAEPEPAAEARKPVRVGTPAPPAAAPSPGALNPVRNPPGNESDDGEGIEPGSLLAGPRNVQPYVVKRGELYMSKDQLQHFRNILNS